MNSSLIYEFDGLLGDSLTVYLDRIMIRHIGVGNMIVMGMRKDKTLYLKDIVSIRFEKADPESGFIHFKCPAQSNGNTIIYFKGIMNEEAEEIARHLNMLITRLHEEPTVEPKTAEKQTVHRKILDDGTVAEIYENDIRHQH